MMNELQTLVQTDEPPIVFVSYSHKDEAWKNKLLPQLKNLDRLGILQMWDDRNIKAGVDWYAKIHDVLSKTKVAICLVSPDFLSSSFCLDEEVSYLLQRRNRGDLEIFPILLRDCVWDEHYWLKRLQMLPRDGKAIASHFNDDPDLVFADVARQVRNYLRSGSGWERPKPKGPAPKTDINRLPASDDILFGRRDELNFLDKTWKDNQLNVAVLKASGGVGKSSLVRCWVEDMELDNYRGARRIYAWSFYSQGTKERVTSADLFLDEALAWFGDETRGEGLSAWDKGQRLADLIRQQRTLLLLDGLEPLQSGQAFDRGKIKDPGLEVLLFELAKDNPGLCLITTREEITDLWGDRDDVLVGQYDLDKISTTAGRALLRVRGIQGEDDELEQTVRDFGQHAFAVKLLGSFLTDEGRPHVKYALEIPDLPDIDEKDGKHPRRVIAAFADRFDQSPKANILAMLGLFNRSADADCIRALRSAPEVNGLNESTICLSDQKWEDYIADLRLLSLLSPESHHAERELDAHPLVREHFADKLRQRHPDAWKAGHHRLYEYLKDVTVENQPTKLVEMTPLFLTVQHGCMAKHHREALLEVYKPRISRYEAFYLTKELGAFGTDLDVISSFFDPPWENPASDLDEDDQTWLLKIAAFNFRAVGRPHYSTSLMQTCLERDQQQENWEEAAKSASNLSELHLVLGNICESVNFAKISVSHADQDEYNIWQRISRTTLADAYHQRGSLEQALSLFEDAERRLKNDRPDLPMLFSLRGYRFCDLLLTFDRSNEVCERSHYALDVAHSHQLDPLTIALDKLSLGRALSALGKDKEAQEHLTEAVHRLRQANTRHYVPSGLLARSAFYQKLEEHEKSRKDLAEAMRIAERSKMLLHKCDAHLEYARLALAEREQDTAREHLESAASLVNTCGYHRRDGEIKSLKKKIGLEEAAEKGS